MRFSSAAGLGAYWSSTARMSSMVRGGGVYAAPLSCASACGAAMSAASSATTILVCMDLPLPAIIIPGGPRRRGLEVRDEVERPPDEDVRIPGRRRAVVRAGVAPFHRHRAHAGRSRRLDVAQVIAQVVAGGGREVQFF